MTIGPVSPTASNLPAPVSPPAKAAPAPDGPKDSAQLQPTLLERSEKLVHQVVGVVHAAANATQTALAVVPTVGSLVLARELARVSGERDLSAGAWLQERMPALYTYDVDRLLPLVAKATGGSAEVSPQALVDVNRDMYQLFAPGTDAAGKKTVPPLLQQLSDHGLAGAAYVNLGQGREAASHEVMEQWNRPDRPLQNPFPPGDLRQEAWAGLERNASAGEPPVVVSLDGDLQHPSPTDYMAHQTAASMWQAAAPGQPLSWLATRLQSSYSALLPWMQRTEPDLFAATEAAKAELRPPWLGGQGIGATPRADHVNAAFKAVSALATQGPARFADGAVALDRDVLTGFQTHWIKLLRESGPERREQLFAPLAQSWVTLALSDDESQVSPTDAPPLREMLPSGACVERRYDRAQGLAEVVEHTLAGSGLHQRSELLGLVRSTLEQQLPELEARDAELRTSSPGYAGVDLTKALSGKADLAPLQALAEGPNGEHARRLLSLLQVAGGSELPPLGLDPKSPAFANDPLAVSQFFGGGTANATPVKATPQLAAGVSLGGSGRELPTSVVFEGGGGEGAAYMGAMEALEKGLKDAPVQLSADEFTGTSAGALTAGLMAAGFTPEEYKATTDKLDFKSFYDGAASLEAGNDPQVRGIDRSGIFSMRKMYQTVYGLLSDKLGVSGRPILFSDLPHKLSTVVTVTDTDLPVDDPLRKQIGADGRMVLSSTATPNFDVVAAIVASTSIPAFFDSPQVDVLRGGQSYHMQFADGGTVDNLATTATSGADAMAMLPVTYEGQDEATGQKAALKVLDFGRTNPVIDAVNAAAYSKFAPQLGQVAADSGAHRLELAFNLATPAEQAEPIVQGKTAAETDRLHAVAVKDGLPQLSEADGRAITRAKAHAPTRGQEAAAWVYKELFAPPDGKAPTEETSDVLQAASRAAGDRLNAQFRPFEEP